MKKRLLLVIACGMVLAFTACGQNQNTETEMQTEPASSVETADTAVMETSAETKEEDETVAVDASQDLRSVAEGFVGKSCTDLVDAIGECESIHPAGSQTDDGKYRGYLHYEDFEVEFESDDETYLEHGDLSGCTVTAIVESMFD